MVDFSTLRSCKELTPARAKEAAASREAIQSLLRQFVAIARAGDGCPLVLMAIARLHGQPWMEGQLRAEIAEDGNGSILSLYVDIGGGFLERLMPPARFPVPLHEFSTTIELMPDMVIPLRVTDEPDKIVLTPLLSPESNEPKPSAFELEDASLGEDLRSTAPPPAASSTDPLPRFYDDVPDEGQSTATDVVILQYARLSNLEAIPRLLVNDVSRLALDPRAALVVSFIDGQTPLRRMLDTCPVSEEEVLRILGQLIRLRVIAVS